MARLDGHVAGYRNRTPHDDVRIALTVQNFLPFLAPDAKDRVGLELGCSNGDMTALWAEQLGRVEVVEGSSKFLEQARSCGLRNVRFHHCLFEDFAPCEKYDYVFACYILPSLEDAGTLLQRTALWLKPGGLLYVVVPNARSLSRQLAVHVGAMESIYALSENDRNHGIHRVYDLASLRREIEGAGFATVAQGGIMLKMLADFQMDQLHQAGILTPQLVDGLYALGHEYPDLCGSIFSVARAAAPLGSS